MNVHLIWAAVFLGFLVFVGIGATISGNRHNEIRLAELETTRVICSGDLASDSARAVACARLVEKVR